MPKVCILIAASPNPAFYSQVAAMSLAIKRLPWKHWEPSILVSFGEGLNTDELAEWLPYLESVDINFVSAERSRRDGIWAQSDEVFRIAPIDADVLLAMDADTLPVKSGLEDMLDIVLHEGTVSGLIAHYQASLFKDRLPEEGWNHLAKDFINANLDFRYTCSLLDESTPDSSRRSPFYLNFGVVFFSRQAFNIVIPKYLQLRPKLVTRVPNGNFSGQVALTLAITEMGVKTRELPMRFNFANDAVAEKLHPEELEKLVVFHYLRTKNYDRHHIFATESNYLNFLNLPLTGVDRVFQNAVKSLLGSSYPFR